jgi:Mn2+/Fe2+ NRAMP family transporter
MTTWTLAASVAMLQPLFQQSFRDYSWLWQRLYWISIFIVACATELTYYNNTALKMNEFNPNLELDSCFKARRKMVAKLLEVCE